MSDKKQSVGGAWIKTAKSGLEFISVSIGDKRYVMYKNGYKKGNQPDYKIYEDDWKPTQTATNSGQLATQQADNSDMPF